jgi:hypothetical protein
MTLLNDEKTAKRRFIGGADWKNKKLSKAEVIINKGIERSRANLARAKLQKKK